MYDLREEWFLLAEEPEIKTFEEFPNKFLKMCFKEYSYELTIRISDELYAFLTP